MSPENTGFPVQTQGWEPAFLMPPHTRGPHRSGGTRIPCIKHYSRDGVRELVQGVVLRSGFSRSSVHYDRQVMTDVVLGLMQDTGWCVGLRFTSTETQFTLILWIACLPECNRQELPQNTHLEMFPNTRQELAKSVIAEVLGHVAHRVHLQQHYRSTSSSVGCFNHALRGQLAGLMQGVFVSMSASRLCEAVFPCCDVALPIGCNSSIFKRSDVQV